MADEPQTPEASVEALQLLTRVNLLALRALSENLAQSDNPLAVCRLTAEQVQEIYRPFS